MIIPQDKIDLFWSYVDKRGQDECWNWNAGLNGGYGQFWIGKKIKAHRLSWILANNQEIPDSLVVKHSCDNPTCVNPNHLSVGTIAENNKEAIDRHRMIYDEQFNVAISNGMKDYFSANPNKRNKKLTNDEVLEIRRKHSVGYSLIELAELYSVSKMNISKIVRYKTYPNLIG